MTSYFVIYDSFSSLLLFCKYCYLALFESTSIFFLFSSDSTALSTNFIISSISLIIDKKIHSYKEKFFISSTDRRRLTLLG